jgi:hypothetical protein
VFICKTNWKIIEKFETQNLLSGTVVNFVYIYIFFIDASKKWPTNSRAAMSFTQETHKFACFGSHHINNKAMARDGEVGGVFFAATAAAPLYGFLVHLFGTIYVL